jgi:hypothetical protein
MAWIFSINKLSGHHAFAENSAGRHQKNGSAGAITTTGISQSSGGQ